MSPKIQLLKAVIPSLLLLAGCATTSTKQWSAAGGNREAGVVKLKYEYPEFHQPQVSDAQAAALALDRCNSWGFKNAEPLAGQIRQCSNMDDGNCDLWTVTREFQCSGAGSSYASRLSR